MTKVKLTQQQENSRKLGDLSQSSSFRVIFVCPHTLPLFVSFYQSPEGGGGEVKREWLEGVNVRKRCSRGVWFKLCAAVPKTYPNRRFCDAVILISAPLDFTSVHSQKVSAL